MVPILTCNALRNCNTSKKKKNHIFLPVAVRLSTPFSFLLSALVIVF